MALPKPTGYSGSAAVARVRSKTNEPSMPPDAAIYGFLNAGVEQLETELAGIFNNANVPILAGASTVQLPIDVQQIIDLTYSLVLPAAAGAVIYNITLLEEDNFMYAAGYQPAHSGGQPECAMILTDLANADATQPGGLTPGQITLQLFPFPSANGFINVYYKQRPVLWDQANPNNGTTLDSAFQEAAIKWAVAETLEARERKADKAWAAYEAQLQKMLATIRKRTRPRVGQVRDVTGTVMNIPYWYQVGSD